jgi:CheY-like chemotaxis protein
MADMNCNILYIEDDLDNQMLLSFYMKNESAKLESVSDGNQALERMQNSRYDLLILDWNLPGDMTGSKLLQTIRTHHGYEHTPILILTAHASKEDLTNLNDEDIAGCLFKPIKKNELLDKVHTVCTGKAVS